MPAFSRAMSARVGPRCSVWSSEREVMAGQHPTDSRNGDAAAAERFERLFRRHLPDVTAYARRRAPAEAADDLQHSSGIVRGDLAAHIEVLRH